MGIVIWSGLIWVIETLARLFSFLSPKMSAILKARDLDKLPHIEKAASKNEYRVLFFCSSAGEYEQAKPLMNSLIANANARILIVFFSESGSRFASKRGENIPYILAPFDNIWHWQKVFNWFCPDDVIITRHEIWPAFIHCAKKMAKRVYLVNASLREKDSKFLSWRYDKKILLSYFDAIFLVDDQQVSLFENELAIKRDRLFVAGDTKFDRVFERVIESQQKVANWKKIFSPISSYPARVVLGSAWPKDYELVLSAYKMFKAKSKGLALIIAPHEVDVRSLRALRLTLQKVGQEWQLLSTLLAGEPYQPEKVLLVDLVGNLAELYSLANMAFVGGAMHNKVHNVLEPAVYGLSVSFGPRYHDSAEAVSLLARGLVSVIYDSPGFCTWMEQEGQADYNRGARLQKALEGKRGASTRICSQLLAKKLRQ